MAVHTFLSSNGFRKRFKAISSIYINIHKILQNTSDLSKQNNTRVKFKNIRVKPILGVPIIQIAHKGALFSLVFRHLSVFKHKGNHTCQTFTTDWSNTFQNMKAPPPLKRKA